MINKLTMMLNSKRISLVFLSITAILFTAPVLGQEQLSKKDGKHVVLISIDGFAAYHLENGVGR